VLSYLVIDQLVSAREVTRLFWDPACSANAAQALTPGEYVCLVDKDADRLDPIVEAVSAQPIVGEGATQLVEEAAAIASENRHIVFQNLRIAKSVVFQVTYRLRTRGYEAWLLGEKLRVLAQENPVTDLVRRWMHDACLLWKKREYLEATETLSEVWQIGVRNSDCRNVIRAARGSMPWGLRPLTLLQYYLDTRGWPWLVFWVIAIGVLIGGCIIATFEILKSIRAE
jgi:hypothetical protein